MKFRFAVMKTLWVGLGMAIFCALPAAAQEQQDEPLQPDRPDFASGTTVVDRVQVETGYTYARTGDDRSHTVGEVLVRMPVSRKAELRLGVPSYVRQRGPGGNASGASDAFIGTKISLWPSKGRGLKKPAGALLLGTTLPTGAQALQADTWQPQGALALDFDLSDSVSLTTNVGYGRPHDGIQSFSQFFGIASLGVDLGGKWGAYAEIYGFDKTDSTGNSAKYADTGLTYLINNDLMLDARLGFGLGNQIGGPEFYAGAGVSKRF